jgi:branched-chain amino acid aminotransferase
MSITPFDDRDGFIWMDGVLLPWRSAKIHVLTHGLHYASAVFEGERAYAGRVFKLTEHSQRLIDSARILGFDLPMTVDEIDRATEAVLAANKIRDGYVRPIAWRGTERMSIAAPDAAIHVAIACWVRPSDIPPEVRARGIRLTVADWARPAPNTAPVHSKCTGLYMICTLAKHAATAAGFDDALMLDWRGRIAEATGANIFLVIDGELHTPTPDCFLDGITRRAVMDLARARGITVVERAIEPQELARAQEAFLTGTAAEIVPVREIAGRIGEYRFTPGAVTRILIDEFDRATGKCGPESA